MATNQEIQSLEQAVDETTQRLMSMQAEDREKYVNEIIVNLGEVVKLIASEKRPLVQGKLAKQLLGELTSNAPQLIPALLYAIKDEYRPGIVKIINESQTIFTPTPTPKPVPEK